MRGGQTPSAPSILLIGRFDTVAHLLLDYLQSLIFAIGTNGAHLSPSGREVVADRQLVRGEERARRRLEVLDQVSFWMPFLVPIMRSARSIARSSAGSIFASSGTDGGGCPGINARTETNVVFTRYKSSEDSIAFSESNRLSRPSASLTLTPHEAFLYVSLTRVRHSETFFLSLCFRRMAGIIFLALRYPIAMLIPINIPRFRSKLSAHLMYSGRWS